MRRRRAVLAAITVIGAVAGSPDLSRGASALRLPFPAEQGTLKAGTYAPDAGGRVGSAELAVVTLANGNVQIELVTGIENSARMEARAELTPMRGSLQLISERSESFDLEGHSLGVMRIDHRLGSARCIPTEASDATREIVLPVDDRVVNVPLMLLFQPLASGKVKHVAFQLFVCRGKKGPRLYDFEASVAPHGHTGTAGQVVEIEYHPVIRFVPRMFLPSYSFWMRGDGRYLAHRLPLYSDGPEVMVVRSDISPTTLEPLTD